MATKLDNRQVVNRSALAFIGSAANDSEDTILPKVNNELAKAFEDKNAQISQGGTLTFNGTAVSFTEALQLTIPAVVAGADPVTFDLGSTTRNVSASGKMIYAVLNRTATKDTTFTVTIASPAVFTTSGNHDLFIGQAIYFTTNGALPTGLTANTVYYVSAVPSATTYRVSATLGGSDVNTTGSQSGVQTQHTIGTVSVTADSSTLPAVTSSNQEVYLIARRFDAQDGTARIYFRNGFVMNSGDSARLGAATGSATTFLDSVFRVKNSGDNTKQLAFDASGISTGTTRTLVIPDSSGTIVLTSFAQSLSSKTLDNTNIITIKDANFTVQNTSDTSKQVKFDASGITTATTRTFIWPDANGTVALLAATQTFSNKTFSDAITNTQIATPSNPSASNNKTYFKSDNGFYSLTSAGVETLIGSPTDNVTTIESYLANAFQAYIDTSQVMTPTTGAPGAGLFYSSIVNRASMVDFRKDLKCRIGVDRFPIGMLTPITGEFGPNNEFVCGIYGDIENKVRAVGSWSDNTNSADLHGNYITSTVSGDFIEVTFFGTGINGLFDLTSSSMNALVAIDGGSDSANIFAASYTTLIQNKNWSTNQRINLFTAQSVGVHTVRLKNNSANQIRVYGFEILNESSNVTVSAGTGYYKGKAYTAAASQTFAYTAPVTGTKGGRALVYLNADGTLGQAWQAVDASSQTFTSTDHTNEEPIPYDPHEFGYGTTGTNSEPDALSTTGTACGSTLDDGTTTSVFSSGLSTTLATSPNYRILAITDSANAFNTITFVGTGFDLVRLNDATGTAQTLQVSIDGAAPTIITNTGYSFTTPQVQKICSGLAYGTHTIKISVQTTAGSNHVGFVKYLTYRPKRPALPANTIALGEYFVTGNYANGTTGLNTVATGVIRKMNMKEFVYSGTWGTGTTPTIDATNSESGFEISSVTNGGKITFIFWGTGFEFRMRPDSAATAPTFNVVLDGATNLTVTNGSFWTGSLTTGFYGSVTSFTASSGAVVTSTNATGNGTGIYVSGANLGLHTLTLTLSNTPGAGNGWNPTCIDVITPIYMPTQLSTSLQRSGVVGDCSIGDLRSVSAIGNYVPVKAKAMAFGQRSGTSFTVATAAIAPDMKVKIPTSGGALRIDYVAQVSATCNLYLFVDEIMIGPVNTPAAADTVSQSWTVPVPAGIHNVMLYDQAASGNFVGILRNLTVTEL